MTFEQIESKLKTHDLWMGDAKIEFDENMYVFELPGCIFEPYQIEKLLEANALKWVEKPDVMKEFGWERELMGFGWENGNFIIHHKVGHSELQEREAKGTILVHQLRLPTKENCVYAHENWELIQQAITELSQEVMPEGTIVKLIKPETE